MNLGWQRAQGGQRTVQLLSLLHDSSARWQQICVGLFIGIAGEEVLEGQWFGDPDKDLSAGASDKQAGRLVLNQRHWSK